MNPKIVDVNVSEGYLLVVRFDNNNIKNYDISKLFSDSRFEVLKDKVLFKNVKVDAGGYGISWNDDVDISEYEIWTNGELAN